MAPTGDKPFSRRFLDWLLGKASPEYIEQITGGRSYWNDVLKERGTALSTTDVARDVGTFDPVFGLPEREVASWLRQNAHLEPAYRAEVQRRQRAHS